uniref:Uncharacterized protein n=1 Tax=Physcomitrium patens TaxID=3218 RepID=A0A2K1KU66_PHYPA|nr:hypothetical protein PHYPA_004315 [Physcomitrium patens]
MLATVLYQEDPECVKELMEWSALSNQSEDAREGDYFHRHVVYAVGMTGQEIERTLLTIVS